MNLTRVASPLQAKTYPSQSRALQNQVPELPCMVVSTVWHLRLSHPPLLQHDLLPPPALCLSLPSTGANDGCNGRGLVSPSTEEANTGPRCRQEFSPKAPLLLQPSQTSRGSAASISQGYSPRSQRLCPATLLPRGKQGGYFLCLSLNSVSKHSPHKKTELGRIDLCTILHLPNGLASNCWVSQMQKGSRVLCMAGLYLIYLSLLFPSPFLTLDKTRP